ncbi:hypothetical protein GE061_012982 [Apolygus lucorum]|uniref:RNA-polymerase II-associated protein 3-like C-terminal domain-containing protein n=1 Tax=Apolygus lucorum TaxID=248454 RepID=A0A8S9XV75_APOLU|nr:hypothetical protein GE061_012982 [Apolygus lucorum]
MISDQDFTRGSNRLQDKLHLLESPDQKYCLLKETGANEILRSFKREIPVGTFGEVIEALLVFPVTTQDVLFVVSVLEALTKTERFRLSLEFLSCSEKDRLLLLLDKISKSLPNRHQDLAEENVTEWTVEKLKEKYAISKKKPHD